LLRDKKQLEAIDKVKLWENKKLIQKAKKISNRSKNKYQQEETRKELQVMKQDLKLMEVVMMITKNHIIDC
jgi:hypothetical protein